ncbi:putative phosphorolytic exoribonuclease [Kockovaella imperatae]|uniref:Ribosomal RNA-processing protein 41 n=1 Tax=Kockovaella imperatae TaxID=4999 RepID=A0A1Y1U6Z9_9TREE|nr:putative phosphorolytic exoribonuclease [Kockovaella imperatae]ORX33277.1 putative phosphorolytic exoribonuclease [Kockovaella imperatae]
MASSRLEILNDGGLRHDARRPYELRSLSLELSTHPNADGSSTVSQGLTTVSASVFGPREPKQRAGSVHDKASVVVEVGVAPWAGAREVRRTRGDKRLLEIAAAIRQTFEPVIMTHLYPRSEIAVHIQVISADGGILPTAINATTLALVDAGISLIDYVTSLSLGLHLTQPLLDLSAPEEADLPTLVVAALPSGKVTLAQMETRLHVDRFEEMLTLGVEGCGVLKTEMDRVVKDRTTRVVERMDKVIQGRITGD